MEENNERNYLKMKETGGEEKRSLSSAGNTAKEAAENTASNREEGVASEEAKISSIRIAK